MNRAIDRDQIINELFKGRGEPMYNTIFHPVSGRVGTRAGRRSLTTSTAMILSWPRQLLDQAGFPGDNGQNRF